MILRSASSFSASSSRPPLRNISAASTRCFTRLFRSCCSAASVRGFDGSATEAFWSAVLIIRTALKRPSSLAFIAATRSFCNWSDKGILISYKLYFLIMYIRKQRLLTPGPTPLYPPALRAMMASDLHHRTAEFRTIYKGALTDLQAVYGTRNDVLCFTASGTGAMEASVSNLFSRGDKAIVCTAGKFGERWAEITRAYGLDATVLEAEYGDVVTPDRVEAALKAEPGAKGVFLQASESSTGAEHDVCAIAGLVKKTDAILVVDAITGLGTMPLDIDGWGLDVVIGGSQKAFMIPPGLAFLSVSEKAWERNKTASLPRYYFDLRKEKKSGDASGSTWTPATAIVLALAV